MAEGKTVCDGVVFVRYKDHVLFHRGNPSMMKPQIREALGWLVRDDKDYIVICWDRDSEPPTLKGGDAKASGLVLLRSVILELRVLMNEFSHQNRKVFPNQAVICNCGQKNGRKKKCN